MQRGLTFTPAETNYNVTFAPPLHKVINKTRPISALQKFPHKPSPLRRSPREINVETMVSFYKSSTDHFIRLHFTLKQLLVNLGEDN